MSNKALILSLLLGMMSMVVIADGIPATSEQALEADIVPVAKTALTEIEDSGRDLRRRRRRRTVTRAPSTATSTKAPTLL